MHGRLKLFICIFAVIILVHVVVLGLIVRNSGGDTAGANPPAPAAQTADTQTDKDKKEAESVKKTGKTPPPKPQKPEKPRRLRQRRPVGIPNFGKPLDYTGAFRGPMPFHLVPGDTSTSGIIVDMQTRKVLWEKNSRKAFPIASMSKMMTILLTMEHLDKNPSLSLTMPVKISRQVQQLPSREGIVWLDPRETFPLSDLIKCAAIKSANDAALQLALTVSGNEAAFVSMMNARAQMIGMTGTRFINAHGLPDKKKNQSVSTAHDMVLLGERLLEYPFVMQSFATPVSSIRQGDKKTVIRNTNRLIHKNSAGAEGMKTGYTRKAGFCLTFSVVRNNRRVMGCVTGFKTSRERDAFCKGLIDWVYAGCPDKALSSPNVTARKTAVRKNAVRKGAPRKNKTVKKQAK